VALAQASSSSGCLSIVPAAPAPLCFRPVPHTPLRMLVPVITCSGRELVVLDAGPSWRLIDVLAAIPEQDRALDCSEHVFIGTTELRPNMILSDIEVGDGNNMTLVKTPVHTAQELEHVVRIIYSKALAEPDSIETHADMIFSLRTRYPEFPPAHEGKRVCSFTRILTTICQEEFEKIPTSLDPFALKRKAKALALMKLIGNLCLRQMIAVKAIGWVLHDLLGARRLYRRSGEHLIECACELLKIVGFTLENTRHGNLILSQAMMNLMCWRNLKKTSGTSVLSKAVTSQIQDVINKRGRNWRP